jgi:hypothetical protein
MNHRRALIALGLSALAVTVAPSIASASSVGEAFNAPIASDSENLGGYHIGGGDSLGLAHFDVDVAAKATWAGNLSTVVAWDTAKVRQGADLPVSRSSLLQSGTMKVRWTVSGSVKPTGFDTVDFGTKTIGDDATCWPQLMSGNYTCVAISDGLPLVKTPGLPASPYVKLSLKATFTVTGEGAIVNRSFSLGGSPVSTASNLPLNLIPTSDAIKVPCAGVGSSASYRLTSFRYTPAVAVTQQPTVVIGLMDPVLGLAESPALYNKAFGPAIHSNPSFDLTGGGHSTDLGPLLANNITPTIPYLGGYTAKVGVPVQLSANAVTSNCPVASYVWKFEDGTTAYGPNPQRTFSKAGLVDGYLTVTDSTGQSSVRDFWIDVKN